MAAILEFPTDVFVQIAVCGQCNANTALRNAQQQLPDGRFLHDCPSCGSVYALKTSSPNYLFKAKGGESEEGVAVPSGSPDDHFQPVLIAGPGGEKPDPVPAAPVKSIILAR